MTLSGVFFAVGEVLYIVDLDNQLLRGVSKTVIVKRVESESVDFFCLSTSTGKRKNEEKTAPKKSVGL